MPLVLAPDESSLAQAVDRLTRGDVVAFATETVYGLGADTLNAEGLEKVFELKGRPLDNPLIAHVLTAEQAQRLTLGWDMRCDALVSRFWPGPLTLVLVKDPRVPDRATAGRPTIAVRSPAHPVARQLLQAFGSAISAPSANRSGLVSPTTAQHVAADFADVPNLLVLDGGPSLVGIESTVLDLTTSPARILRPGTITADQVREVLHDVDDPIIHAQTASPGTAARHYAPRTPASLVTQAELAAMIEQSDQPFAVMTPDPRAVPPPHRAIAMPANPEDYAKALYSALREADQLHVSRILIQTPPRTNELWRAVHDRLVRATTNKENG